MQDCHAATITRSQQTKPKSPFSPKQKIMPPGNFLTQKISTLDAKLKAMLPKQGNLKHKCLRCHQPRQAQVVTGKSNAAYRCTTPECERQILNPRLLYDRDTSCNRGKDCPLRQLHVADWESTTKEAELLRQEITVLKEVSHCNK